MPGLLGNSSIGRGTKQMGQPGGERLTVASLGPEVEMLHTKTRPKKLVLIASDGQRLTFLLKVVFLGFRDHMSRAWQQWKASTHQMFVSCSSCLRTITLMLP